MGHRILLATSFISGFTMIQIASREPAFTFCLENTEHRIHLSPLHVNYSIKLEKLVMQLIEEAAHRDLTYILNSTI